MMTMNESCRIPLVNNRNGKNNEQKTVFASGTMRTI